MVPVAIEQVGSITDTVGVGDGVGIGLMDTFKAGLVHPVLLFVMVIECTDKTNADDLQALLKSNGAVETETQVAEDGWWFGTYDKEDDLYNQKQLA